jgi:xanthine dehydrogenase accessory factor
MASVHTMIASPAVTKGHEMTVEPQATDPDVLARGQSIREVALGLRLLLHRGISFALATVVGVRGVAVRSIGAVLAAAESGESIGFRPDGCLDRAIQELATEVLSSGAEQVRRYEIDEEAASYVGLSGMVGLDVHVMRVMAGDPGFDGVLRCLDSPAATVVVIGTRGVSGYVAVGPDRVAGRLSWAELPRPVVEDARCMLEGHGHAQRSYGSDGGRGGDDVELWMQSHPAAG